MTGIRFIFAAAVLAFPLYVMAAGEAERAVPPAGQGGEATQAQQAAQPAGMAEQAGEQLFGKITDVSVAQDKTVLTLDKPEAGMAQPAASESVQTPEEFIIDSSSRITDGSRTLRPEDLKPGQHLRLTYNEEMGNNRVIQATVVRR